MGARFYPAKFIDPVHNIEKKINFTIFDIDDLAGVREYMQDFERPAQAVNFLKDRFLNKSRTVPYFTTYDAGLASSDRQELYNLQEPFHPIESFLWARYGVTAYSKENNETSFGIFQSNRAYIEFENGNTLSLFSFPSGIFFSDDEFSEFYSLRLGISDWTENPNNNDVMRGSRVYEDSEGNKYLQAATKSVSGGTEIIKYNFNTIATISNDGKGIADWIKSVLTGITPEEDTDRDPYINPDDPKYSTPGGGDGDPNDPDDLIPEPSLPSISVGDTGFVRLYNPNDLQLKNLSRYMWSDAFSLDTFKKILADPMDVVIGIAILPIDIPNGGSEEIKIGGIGTGVTALVASSQWVRFDCGSINLPLRWGSYLDYSPYTKASINLPYIGERQIDIDAIEGANIHVTYHIDIFTGACVAYVMINNSVHYQFSGNCAMSIPFTGSNYNDTIQSIVGLIGSTTTAFATGGASTAASAAGLLSTTSNAVMNAKPHITKSGNMGSTSGLLSSQDIYLTIERPNVCIPQFQPSLSGYPSAVYKNLGNISGFTIVDSINVENIYCTDEERNEIITLLKGGVYL